MKRLIQNIAITSVILILASCTTNRTSYTYDKWTPIETTSDDIVLEEKNSPATHTGFFAKEIVDVHDVEYRLTNNKNKNLCVFFNVKNKKNVSFGGRFKKGRIVKSGETVIVGRVYMNDGSRRWSPSLKVRSASMCKD